MAKATIPRYLRPGSVRQERFLNFPRSKIRPNDTDVPATFKLLTEAGSRITTEAGDPIRKEQN